MLSRFRGTRRRPDGAVSVEHRWPASLDPRVDGVGEPYPPLRQLGDRGWEVRPRGDLVNALAADAAQPYPDLCSAQESHPPLFHACDYSRTPRWLREKPRQEEEVV